MDQITSSAKYAVSGNDLAAAQVAEDMLISELSGQLRDIVDSYHQATAVEKQKEGEKDEKDDEELV